ncbi:MAG TPA: GNAT family N-acetyltransferase [Steroidobacteraceae bacterium]|jgi:GNAT superfamily N-acetyltransferase
MSSYRIRGCTPSDAATIAQHRVCMFRDMGEVPTDEAAAELLEESTVAIRAELERGTYVGWFAIGAAEEVIAGAGAHVKATLPRMSADRAGRIATSPVPLVVNVYTEPAWRHRGLAHALMRALMQWAGERGFDRVVLHASNQARSLYASLGFVASNEMRWAVTAGQDEHPIRRDGELES